MWCGAALTVLLAQRPLDAPELWWHLARGRAVLDGAIAPSRQLLALDTAAEADWLGGVPAYALWSIGGVPALATVPLLTALALLIFTLRRADGPVSLRAALVWLPLVLWLMRDGLQPVPVLFDLIGMMLVWHVVRADLSPPRQFLAVALSFLVWANFAPQPVWGLLVLTHFASPGKFRFRLLAAALLAGMLTPRGILTWRDAAILFVPAASAGHGEFVGESWRGLLSGGERDGAFAVLLLLWLICVAGARARPGLAQAARWITPLLAAVLCRAHLPACGLWLLLELLSRPASSAPVAAAPHGGRTAPQRLALGLSVAAVTGCTLLDAAGAVTDARLGWGVAHAIDPRLLDVAALETRAGNTLSVWAPDARSTGVVAWLGRGIRMADHPQRALLGGRWQQHADLAADLVSSHRAAYRRDDGSWGGWVRAMQEWDIELLCVPAEHARLNRALIETPWRPADLDSPTVPYVSADDPRFAAVIVEVLRQQGFVEVGPWQPTAGVYSGGNWRLDACEVLGLGPDPVPAIRQSRWFRSLDLPVAALRALLPVRQLTRDRRLAREFRACQVDVAYQEWMTFGAASEFRRRVVHTLSDGWHGRSAAAPWSAVPVSDNAAADDAWRTCVEQYVSGRVEDAAGALPLMNDEQRFAAAMLRLELGDTERARAGFAEVAGRTQEAALAIGAQYWLEQIALFDRGPESP